MSAQGGRRIQPGGTAGCALPAASGAAAEVTARRMRRDEGPRAGAKQRSRKQRSCCDALPSFILTINDHNERIAIGDDARTAVSRFLCGPRCEFQARISARGAAFDFDSSSAIFISSRLRCDTVHSRTCSLHHCSCRCSADCYPSPGTRKYAIPASPC